VAEIKKEAKFRMEYDPDHPYANADGYVKMPGTENHTAALVGSTLRTVHRIGIGNVHRHRVKSNPLGDQAARQYINRANHTKLLTLIACHE